MAETGSMTEKNPLVGDLAYLSAGRRVEAFSGGVLCHRGVVEETFPDLGVVWIRVAGTGSRKMLDATGYDLRPR